MRMLELKSDHELMALIQEGNSEAFEELYGRYFKPLLYFTAKRTNDLADAEDIVHDVFTKFWERRFKIENKNISSFLYQCTLYAILDRIKKLKNKNTVVSMLAFSYPQCEDPIEQQLFEDELKAKFDEAINLNTSKVKEVFKLRYEEDMSYKEIATAHGVSIETVKAQVKKGLKTMRKHLRIFTTFYFF